VSLPEELPTSFLKESRATVDMGGANCGTSYPSDLKAEKAATLASSALSRTILRAPFFIFFATPNCKLLCAEPSKEVKSTFNDKKKIYCSFTDFKLKDWQNKFSW
jgi:hypothetical protein